jgi:hypothetical protein
MRDLKLGVELEMDEGYVPSMIDFLHEFDPDEHLLWQAYDGSLSAAGIEIVTQPCTLRFHHEEFPWKELLMKAKSLKFMETDTCGMHIHVGRSWVNKVRGIRLGAFVYANSFYIDRLARRTRCEQYARLKRIGDHIASAHRSLDYRSSNHMITEGHENRYEAVNYTNSETIELRMFRGSLDIKVIWASLELVDAICRFVCRVGTPYLMNPSVWMSFVHWVYDSSGKNYSNLKWYMTRRGVSKGRQSSLIC